MSESWSGSVIQDISKFMHKVYNQKVLSRLYDVHSTAYISAILSLLSNG